MGLRRRAGVVDGVIPNNGNLTGTCW